MSEFVSTDPWVRPRFAWLKPRALVELSQVWVIVLVLANLALIGWLVVNWTLNSIKLTEQDARITSLNDDVDNLKERVDWASTFVRTRLAVNSVVAGKMSPRQVGRLTETLWNQSRTYEFDPLLIVAVMQAESRSNPGARGHLNSGTESGALGLMQVKLGTAQIVGRNLGLDIRTEADMMKPDVNLLLGTYYLLRQIVRYGNVNKGLMAYNIGPQALEQRIRVGARLPTDYSHRILQEYRRLTKRYGVLE